MQTIKKWDGKPISESGWYADVPIEKYHSAGICNDVAVSSSNLRTCWKSPAHMFAEWCEAPDYEPKEATRNMILGAAAHHLFLGEDGFKLRFIGQPETYRDVKTAEVKAWNYNANWCKDWRSQQEDKGLVIVTAKEFRAILGMAKSLTTQPLVQEGLLSGYVETSGFFRDKLSGLWLKVRPDVIPISGPDFVDLKTTSDVTSVSLMSTIRTYSYHMQGALIWEVCEALGQEFTSFNLMFVETSAPYCARHVPLLDVDLDIGRQQNRLMLKQIRACMDLGRWPGPGEGEDRALGLSKDERERIAVRLKIEGAMPQ